VTFRSYPKEVRGLKFVMQLERLLCDLAKAVLEKHKRYLGWPTIGREEREKKKGFWRKASESHLLNFTGA